MYLTMKPEGWKAKKWAEQLARGKMEASVDVVEPIMCQAELLPQIVDLLECFGDLK
ncbi:hypothetical protein DB88DRAFT_513838 [Papiliotrema laurentii]|uniref:Uncharacterized protein n=1 Tax=Papiliotrema laurentii TaxID=5418 RepID=A0AAD9CTP6_PAPLA|nr:hypothetical protein DB88DRAFT_543325 [Papiliotrema laurentii]KAK1920714.1 hypothetical protein DB88DRAFT_513838 [Papiliotrema laurentii]